MSKNGERKNIILLSLGTQKNFRYLGTYGDKRKRNYTQKEEKHFTNLKNSWNADNLSVVLVDELSMDFQHKALTTHEMAGMTKIYHYVSTLRMSNK